MTAATSTDGGLADALANLGPNALVYVMSFMTLGISGSARAPENGARSWRTATGTTSGLARLFARRDAGSVSTQLLARFPTHRLALVEWLNIVLLGGILFAALEYAHRAHLFQETDERDLIQLMRGRILIAQSLYALATALSLFFSTWVSIALIVLVRLNYVLAPRIPICAGSDG